MSRFSNKNPMAKGRSSNTQIDDLLFEDDNDTGSNAQTTESVVLEEELPEDYEPTEEEILEYAKWLGMDIEQEKDLFWIAREGLKAPLPENWKPCKTGDEEIYYFNFSTGESVWDHPCDEYYRKVHCTIYHDNYILTRIGHARCTKKKRKRRRPERRSGPAHQVQTTRKRRSPKRTRRTRSPSPSASPTPPAPHPAPSSPQVAAAAPPTPSAASASSP